MSKAEICRSIIKWILCLISALFMGLGIMLVVVGMQVLSRAGEYDDLIQHGFFSIPALLLITGTVVTVVFFFGLIGVARNIYCMAMTFSVLMVIILLIEIVGAVAAFLLPYKADGVLKGSLTSSFDKYNQSADVAMLWDRLQTSLECCGVNGPQDYASRNMTVPNSCRPSSGSNSTVPHPNMDSLTQVCSTPCLSALEGFVKTNSFWMMEILLIVAGVHIVWIIGSCFVARSRRGYSPF